MTLTATPQEIVTGLTTEIEIDCNFLFKPGPDYTTILSMIISKTDSIQGTNFEYVDKFIAGCVDDRAI